MITLTSLPSELEAELEDNTTGPVATRAHCYSLTIFTQRWRDVRSFYVDLLGAEVLSERTDRYCEINLGGVPLTLRMAEHGEIVSYFHLYVAMPNRDTVLGELRRRGIIVTAVGPYTNFRDPEGRVIKLSEQKTIVS